MTDIVAFLTARLDEDERVALAVSEGPRKPEVWEAKPWPYGQAPRDWAVDCPFGAVIVDGSFKDAAIHIARHNPARVTREIAAKRETIRRTLNYMMRIDGEFGCNHNVEAIAAGRCEEERPEDEEIFLAMALIYADHPDYDPAWRVE